MPYRSDSDATKLGGAILNALALVAVVTIATFGLVALFYFRCGKFIWVYMGFSGFTILAGLGGSVLIQLIQVEFELPFWTGVGFIETLNRRSV